MRVGLQVLRAEGWRGFGDRTLDRLEEARRRRSFGSPAPASSLLGLFAALRTPVLHVAATPPAPRLGGVQAQLLARMEREARERPFALLFPTGGRWRLEVAAPEGRRAWEWDAAPSPGSFSLTDPAFEEAVRRAAAAVGAELLHVEGLGGMPVASLLALARSGLRLTVSLHDFAAFCPRPHLLEEPALRFCEYSRDPQRCAACLRVDLPVEVGWQEERRGIAAELSAAAEAVVYPSQFLRRSHLELFPGLDPARQRVSAPEIEPRDRPRPRRHGRSPGAPLHVAFAGSVQPHKGALVFEEVVRHLAVEAPGAVRWTVYGGGDAGLLLRLRRLPGVRVRGSYRAGSLPRLLARDGVDLALLVSIVPESYGLTLSECRAAGVPAVAFDLGALAERLRAEGGGFLVPLADGAAGVARLLLEVLAERR